MGQKMSNETNAVNWFEIPVTDMDRAKKFYEASFDVQMHSMDMPEMNLKMAMFPTDPTSGRIGGGIAQSQMHKPSATGTIIYLNANPDLQNVLDRVEAAGGKITMPKTSLGPNGYMAFFMDTEGNIVGLHSND